MTIVDAVVLITCVIGMGYCLYKAGYASGRADGIEWTRDVYNGKYDHEILNKNKDEEQH